MSPLLSWMCSVKIASTKLGFSWKGGDILPDALVRRICLRRVGSRSHSDPA